MKLHANAALSLRQRRRMVSLVVDEGWTIKAAAAAFQTSPRTCGKWVSRHRELGECGLLDRSSAPQHVANRTDERAVQVIAALRRLRFTGAEIAELLDRPSSTVSGILTRIGMGRLGRLGLEPAERYERARPGELIHIDVKKLGRIKRGAGKRIFGGHSHDTGSYTDAAGRVHRKAGWDYVHIAIDDATRLAYAEVLRDEKATSAVGFLRRAIAFYRRHGISVERVMTDKAKAKAHLSAGAGDRAVPPCLKGVATARLLHSTAAEVVPGPIGVHAATGPRPSGPVQLVAAEG